MVASRRGSAGAVHGGEQESLVCAPDFALLVWWGSVLYPRVCAGTRDGVLCFRYVIEFLAFFLCYTVPFVAELMWLGLGIVGYNMG